MRPLIGLFIIAVSMALAGNGFSVLLSISVQVCNYVIIYFLLFISFSIFLYIRFLVLIKSFYLSFILSVAQMSKFFIFKSSLNLCDVS